MIFFIDIGAEITHLGALAGTEGQASHWVVERRWNGTTLRPPLSTLSLWTWEEARLFQPPGVAYLQPMYLISCFSTCLLILIILIYWAATCGAEIENLVSTFIIFTILRTYINLVMLKSLIQYYMLKYTYWF